MARTRAKPTGLLVFLGAAAAALAGGGLWMANDQARATREAQTAAQDVPALPTGRLQVVSASVTEARYLDLDSVRRSPDGVNVTVLRVGKAADALEGKVAMISTREVVDCAGRRLFEGRIGAFDADGKLVSATNGYSGERGRPAGPADGELDAVCGSASTGRVFANVKAAQRDAQALPQGYDKRADANPKDAGLWAWLCAAESRGQWRKQAPQDCDRAVALNPADAAVRVDRGFLALQVGRNAPADADFQKAAAMDPQNEAARLGHAAVLELKGDRAAARKILAPVLATDPEAPVWLQHNYRVAMSTD